LTIVVAVWLEVAYLLSGLPVVVCRRSEKRLGGNNEGYSSLVSCRRSFGDPGFTARQRRRRK
jgi:hypothetical protein